MMFDFWSKAPESLHQVTMLFSNRGTPDGYRHMDGFGSHTFSLINAKGSLYYVKWHLKTQQGIKNLTATRATELAGIDPDYAQRDLFEAIERGDFPKWKLMLQVATEKELLEWEKRTGWNPFDLTKVWPHADFPRLEIGMIELNKNPDNYYSHVEQVGFSPANVVLGMGYSPDKMLQGRLFAYHDAQLYRLGANHQQLSVNSPRCPVHNQPRDGLMALCNGADNLNYDPVISEQNYSAGKVSEEPTIALSGEIGRYDARNKEDDYTQAGNLFRLLSTSEKIDLCNNLACPLSQVSPSVLKRQLYHFDQADKSYGQGVREALKNINPNILT
jgi:catalase